MPSEASLQNLIYNSCCHLALCRRRTVQGSVCVNTTFHCPFVFVFIERCACLHLFPSNQICYWNPLSAHAPDPNPIRGGSTLVSLELDVSQITRNIIFLSLTSDLTVKTRHSNHKNDYEAHFCPYFLSAIALYFQ